MKTKIGGQAVLEGVMMRGATSMALSVRDEAGEIRTETTRLAAKKPWYRKVPFLRGVVNLIVSMIDGYKIISKSADVMIEEEIDTSGSGTGWLMAVSMLLGVALALGLFVFLPTAITAGVFAIFRLDDKDFAWLKSLIEGIAKMLVLIGYMAGVSRMKEIRRVFMYHGAEHKTIACYEEELPLTVENVQKCSRYHDRCGTSFLVFVVVLSVILMMVLDVVCLSVGFTAFIEFWWLRALLKVAMLPLTAGVSYEMLMLLANSNFVLFRPLKWLGKQFQRLTTKEPDDSMCEVAIKSFNAVLQMDADPSIPEQRFPEALTLTEFRAEVEKSGLAEKVENADIDWLLCAVLNVKRSDLQKDLKIPFGWTIKLNKMMKRVAGGEPLQYVLGNTEFYGRTFKVTKDVLIPRPETELVTEQALKVLPQNATVLDMCCGSGAIGVTIALESNAAVTMSDVSAKAIEIAKHNAKQNKAKANFVCGDMFQNVSGKFDVIVSNPPYIVSDVVATLDQNVKNYEPHLALDGGVDGLDFYRILATQSPQFLKEGGFLVLEIGYDQATSVTELLQNNFDVEVKKDYSGNDRIVIAKLK